MESFDLETEYDDEISPLMVQIIEICKARGIPMVASFCFSRDEDGEEGHCTTVLPADGRASRGLEYAAAIIRRGVGDGESVRVGSGLVAITITEGSS